MTTRAGQVVLAADLAGTFVFGLEGAFAAIHAHLDLFGVLVLAVVTAVGGGILRDVLIGAVPPQAVRDWTYPAIAVAAGLLAFTAHRFLFHIPTSVLILLDAAGLALFAVAGTEKALDYKLNPAAAVVLGTITGVGGGTIRDVLLSEVPSVLNADIYATAALAGALVVVLARRLNVTPAVAATAGGCACFLLRVLSVQHHWQLPSA